MVVSCSEETDDYGPRDQQYQEVAGSQDGAAGLGSISCPDGAPLARRLAWDSGSAATVIVSRTYDAPQKVDGNASQWCRTANTDSS